MRRAVLAAVAAGAMAIAFWQCGGTTAPNPDASTTDSGTNKDGGTGGDGGTGSCNPACGSGRMCCGTTCINPDNDPLNCGGCGNVCSGSTPYCDGTCKPLPCADAGTCGAGSTCCGSSCCASGQICCKDEGPVTGAPSCYTPTAQAPTCPQGCAPLCQSDRNIKRDIVPVDEQAVLEGVAQMPIATWSYKTDDPSVRHLGPMAQDFHEAFGLGNTDRAYDPIDAHGVAFAAIKALNEKLEQQSARIEKLEAENARLREQGVCR